MVRLYVHYMCGCGFSSEDKTDMRRHSMKKNPCGFEYKSYRSTKNVNLVEITPRVLPAVDIPSLPPVANFKTDEEERGYFYIIVPRESSFLKMGYTMGAQQNTYFSKHLTHFTWKREFSKSLKTLISKENFLTNTTCKITSTQHSRCVPNTFC